MRVDGGEVRGNVLWVGREGRDEVDRWRKQEREEDEEEERSRWIEGKIEGT